MFYGHDRPLGILLAAASSSLLLTAASRSLHSCNFPIGLAARKGLRRATFLCPKRVPKTKKKVASKNPKPKGKLLLHSRSLMREVDVMFYGHDVPLKILVRS